MVGSYAKIDIDIEPYGIQSIRYIQEGSFKPIIEILDVDGKRTRYTSHKIGTDEESINELISEKFKIHIRKLKLKQLNDKLL